MASTATNGALLRPETVEDLLIKPVLASSIATDPRVAIVIRTDAGSVRFPVVATDPSAAWVAEGAEIPISDLITDEVNVTPAKLAGLTVVTSELAEDSSPEAQAIVGQGLSRDIARKLDDAFIGAGGGIVPPGLGSLAAAAMGGDLAIGTAPANLDGLADALAAVRAQGANPTAILVHPSTLSMFSKLKEGTSSSRYLLESDPGKATGKVVFGVPLIASTSLPTATMFVVDASRVYTVVRRNAEIVADASPFFTSDRVAVRATMRAAFGLVHTASVVRVRLAAT